VHNGRIGDQARVHATPPLAHRRRGDGPKLCAEPAAGPAPPVRYCLRPRRFRLHMWPCGTAERFDREVADGLEPDHEHIADIITESRRLVTAPNAKIGYDRTVRIERWHWRRASFRNKRPGSRALFGPGTPIAGPFRGSRPDPVRIRREAAAERPGQAQLLSGRAPHECRAGAGVLGCTDGCGRDPRAKPVSARRGNRRRAAGGIAACIGATRAGAAGGAARSVRGGLTTWKEHFCILAWAPSHAGGKSHDFLEYEFVDALSHCRARRCQSAHSLGQADCARAGRRSCRVHRYRGATFGACVRGVR